MPTTTDASVEVFAKLFAESRQALQRYIRRFVGSSETAKEIMQEAFLRTYRQGESVRTLRAFLFSTAHNLAANEYRHQRTVERLAAGEPALSWVKTECDSPEAEILREERNRLIQEAITRLPQQCRAAFTLRVFHHCSSLLSQR
jgi:RNA polymerase sigma factor (sigma-70 family)